MAARSYPNPPGRPPKPESQRRRRNTPKSYGAAEPTTTPAAEPKTRVLGIDGAHPLVTDMWDTVQRSCECSSTPRRIGCGCAGSCFTRTS